MPTGEDAHGSDYFTPVFLLPQLCNSTIYIDPPFNTAQTFANYEDNLEHSVWLTMMRDRLVHLRKLLSDDGSIWVHLDDVGNHRMRALMDEVFGSGNFVAEISWGKVYSPRSDARGLTVRSR